MRILGFGCAPEAVAAGYSKLATTIHATIETATRDFQGDDVVLVRGAQVFGTTDTFEFGVFTKSLSRHYAGI